MNIKDFKTEEEKISFLKKIYEYCDEYKWDDLKLRFIGKKFNIQGNTVNELAKMYIDYMVLSPIAKERLIIQIKEHEHNSSKKNNLIYKTNPILLHHGIITYNLWNNDQEKELVLKTMNEYAIKVDYNKQKLEKFSHELGISLVTYRKYIKDYNGTTNTKWNDIKQEEQKKKLEPMLKDIYEYCEQNSYSKEAIKYLCGKYNVTEHTINNRAEKYATEYLNKTSEEYYENKQRFIKNAEEKQKTELKEIYEYCELNKYSKKFIRKLSNIYGINPDKVIDKAKKYAINYLGISEEEWKQTIIKYQQELKEIETKKIPENILNIYNQLLISNTFDDINTIINSSGLSLETIENSFEKYLNLFKTKTEQTKIKNHINKYKKELNIRNIVKLYEEKEEYKLSKKIIEDYIHSEYTDLNLFCEINNIEVLELKKHIKRVKKIDQELYIKYLTKNEQNILKYKNILKEIIYLINNKINEFGIIREFDIIDYYELTNITLIDMLKIINEYPNIISKEEFLIFKKFTLKYKEHEINKETDIERILSEKVEVNFKYDEYGKPIPGTGEIFSEESKLKLIEYIKNNNLPINRGIYSLVFKRYRLGLINIDELTSDIKRF